MVVEPLPNIVPLQPARRLRRASLSMRPVMLKCLEEHLKNLENPVAASPRAYNAGLQRSPQ
jgi:hypothetical protein